MSSLGCIMCAGYLYLGLGYDNDSEWEYKTSPLYGVIEVGYTVLSIDNIHLINKLIHKSDPSTRDDRGTNTLELGIKLDF